jgi:uncharacterized protein YbjQ (UPF0145 family)
MGEFFTFVSNLNWALPVALVIFGYLIGSWIERRHFRYIRKREDELRGIMAFALRRLPTNLNLTSPVMVSGNAVISVDYFKMFAGRLRGLIGGKVGAYESLLERARRQAIIRMKEEAARHGGNVIMNVKLDSTRISIGSAKSTISVEAIAYGTCFRSGE